MTDFLRLSLPRGCKPPPRYYLHDSLFITYDFDKYECAECITQNPLADGAELWDIDSEGWLDDIFCMHCERKLASIDLYEEE